MPNFLIRLLERIGLFNPPTVGSITSGLRTMVLRLEALADELDLEAADKRSEAELLIAPPQATSTSW